MNIAELIPASTGRWTWDEMNNGLEFISSYLPDDEKRYKDRQPKLSDVEKAKAKRSRKVIPRPVLKQTKTHTVITLQDVKDFAMSLLSEVETIDEEFYGIFDKPLIDDLQMLLLNYFHWFFEKRSMEANPDPSHIDVSIERRRRLASLSERLDSVSRQLGRTYGLLVLGSEVPELHHMGGGRLRVSSMDRDRKLFEIFYSFSVFVVWLTFKRQDYDIIRYEISRLFRSDSFNPSLSEKREKDTEKLCDAEYRRALGKRPSKVDLANQRSTAMMLIAPKPKEESAWLFSKDGTLSSQYKEKVTNSENSTEDLQQQYKNLSVFSVKRNVGIIGMPLELFNLQTLTVDDEKPVMHQTKAEQDY